MTSHIDVIRTMYDQFVEERTRKLSSIAQMEAGVFTMHVNRVDVTSEQIADNKRHVAELDELIAQIATKYGFERP